MAASSPAVIYMCLFNKQRWLYYTRLISICNRPLICHLYLSTPLSTNPQMKNPAAGTGSSFNVECSQNQDFFICSNNAVKSENDSPFLHVLLPSRLSRLIINCRVLACLLRSPRRPRQIKTPHTADQPRHTISIYMRFETFSYILQQNSSVSQVMNYKNSELVWEIKGRGEGKGEEAFWAPPCTRQGCAQSPPHQKGHVSYTGTGISTGTVPGVKEDSPRSGGLRSPTSASERGPLSRQTLEM